MSKKERRTSILKVRQDVLQLDEDDASQTVSQDKRRVSFHNVKHVKQFDKEGGKFLHSSPLREKIADTMDSDGILTPRGRSLAETSMDISATENETMAIFGNMKKTDANETRTTLVDMSLSESHIVTSHESKNRYEMERTMNATSRTLVEMSIDETVVEGNDTMAIFNFNSRQAQETAADGSMCMDINSQSQYHPGGAVNDTMAVFDTREETIINGVDGSVCMDISSQSQYHHGGVVNDTMNVFNGTQYHDSTMDIENADVSAARIAGGAMGQQENVFAVPALLSTTKISKRDLDQLEDTMMVFAAQRDYNQTVDMSMSMMEAGDEPSPTAEENTLTPTEEIASDRDEKAEEIAEMNATKHSCVDMSMSIIGNDTMQVFNAPTMSIFDQSASDTMCVFNASPEKTIMENNKTMDMNVEDVGEEDEKTENTIRNVMEEEKIESIDMDIEEEVESNSNKTISGSVEVELENLENIQSVEMDTDKSRILTAIDHTEEKIEEEKELVSNSVHEEAEAELETSCGMHICNSTFDALSSHASAQVHPKMETPRRENHAVDCSIFIREPRSFGVMSEKRPMAMNSIVFDGEDATDETLGGRNEDMSRRVSMLHATVLEETVSNVSTVTVKSTTSRRRSILDLNTSQSNHMTTPFPIFDPVVSNIMWLSKVDLVSDEDCGTREEAIKEMEANVVEATRRASMRSEEAQKKLDETRGLNFIQKYKSAKTSKMSTDEKELTFTSRQLAQCRALEMRLKFVQEQKMKYQKSLEEERRIRDLRNAAPSLEKLEREIKLLREIPNVDDQMDPRDIRMQIQQLEMDQIKERVRQLEARHQFVNDNETMLQRAATSFEIVYRMARELWDSLDASKRAARSDIAAIFQQDNLGEGEQKGEAEITE